jgi:2-polyprenyl-6-methoxyphenol hydroxylase-like FAD-dependent oxidoreductase
MKILISGAGIAGATLAFWLAREGHEVTIVEVAPQVRTGGYIVDFWGLGYDVAEKMGLVPELNRRGYFIEAIKLVGQDGKRVGGFSAKVFSRMTNGRFVSLPRSALAGAIYEIVASQIETMFGNEIAALHETADAVEVSFTRGETRAFDLVIGADGLHSRVRELAFGPQNAFERYLGFKVAAFEIAGYQPREPLTYVSFTRPGLQAARFAERGDETLFLLVIADPEPGLPAGGAAEKAYLHARFDHLGWECPAIMAALDKTDRLYLDVASQIEMPRWTKGRIALIGDAAACPSLLAGEGSSLAMAEAYMLAGELKRAQGDHVSAFESYEAQLRPFLAAKQKSARDFSGSFAPRTRFGLAIRNLITHAMAIPFVADLAMGQSVRDDFTLPDYE